MNRRPLIAASAMATLQVFRIAWLSRLPDGLLVQHIPDDAFYYLVLAKNFAAHGRWTFDGVSPSSGFHLLWGYLLALLSYAAPAMRFHGVFVVCSLFAAALLSVSTYWITDSAERLFGQGAAWGVVLVLFSAILLVQGTWLMESPLLLFFASACLAQLTSAVQNDRTGGPLLAFALGMLGTLSRSDFGLLTFWLVLACLAYEWMTKQRRGRNIAVAQFAGAATGVLLLFGHTYVVSHHLTQSSAQVKLWWARLQGRQFLPALHTAENLLNPFFHLHPLNAPATGLDVLGYKLRQVLLLLLLVAAAVWSKKRLRSFPTVLLSAMLGVVLSYVVVYDFDGGLQDWYAVNFALPLCLVAGAAWVSMPRRAQIACGVLVCVLAVSDCALSLRTYLPWQEATYRAGMELRQHTEWKPLGTWNAGAMSYFAGGGVVNLDGLVNDDLLPFIKNGTLIQYMDRRNMTYLIESPNILSGMLARRSGIGDGKLKACVAGEAILFPHDPFDNAYGMHLELLRLDRACTHQAQLR